jgi:hypothetical protein
LHCSFKNFPEFAGTIFRNCYCEQRTVQWHPSLPWGCGQKETPRKMESQQLVSSSRQCSSTPVGFGHRVLSEEQCDNPGASLWPGSSRCLPVPSTEFSIEETALWWCYCHNKECDGRTEKASTKWHVANTCPVASRSVQLHKGAVLKKT